MPTEPADLAAATGADLTNPYLDFVQRPSRGTTAVWEVRSRRSGALLGVIKWYGAWRQYTFWPEPDTIFNTGCLVTITTATDALTHDWRATRER